MFTTRAARRALTLLALTAAAGAATAAAGDAARPAVSAAPVSGSGVASANERQRIASERAAVEARFAARERECNTRFVVTACVDEAKSERRDALDKLRARQLGADEVRRRERAAERQSELAEKATEDARLEKERATARAAAASAAGAASQAPRIRISSPRRGAAPEHAASTASASASRDKGPDKPAGLSGHAGEPAGARQAREARSRAAFEKRQHQAAEHREEATAATLRRMASKSPAAALPAPSAASAAKSH